MEAAHGDDHWLTCLLETAPDSDDDLVDDEPVDFGHAEALERAFELMANAMADELRGPKADTDVAPDSAPIDLQAGAFEQAFELIASAMADSPALSPEPEPAPPTPDFFLYEHDMLTLVADQMRWDDVGVRRLAATSAALYAAAHGSVGRRPGRPTLRFTDTHAEWPYGVVPCGGDDADFECVDGVCRHTLGQWTELQWTEVLMTIRHAMQRAPQHGVLELDGMPEGVPLGLVGALMNRLDGLVGAHVGRIGGGARQMFVPFGAPRAPARAATDELGRVLHVVARIPGLRVLDVSGGSGGVVAPLMPSILSRLPRLEILRMREMGLELDEQLADAISSLKLLRVLHLGGNPKLVPAPTVNQAFVLARERRTREARTEQMTGVAPLPWSSSTALPPPRPEGLPMTGAMRPDADPATLDDTYRTAEAHAHDTADWDDDGAHHDRPLMPLERVLAALPRLTDLDLGGSYGALSAAGHVVAAIARMPGLERLDVSAPGRAGDARFWPADFGTPAYDPALELLEVLVGLPRLTYVSLLRIESELLSCRAPAALRHVPVVLVDPPLQDDLAWIEDRGFGPVVWGGAGDTGTWPKASECTAEHKAWREALAAAVEPDDHQVGMF